MELKENLRALKKASGLTSAAISEGTGIPLRTLENIFSGTTKEPTFQTVYKILAFLGYTMDDLVHGIKETPPEEKSSKDVLSVGEVEAFLIEAGLIQPGRHISDDDLRFLSAQISALNAWFQK